MIGQTELCNIALRYGTDKAVLIGHSYTPWYHKVLHDRRASTKKVLEIGIERGASLFMWKDYFPNAEIFGLDIDDSKLIFEDRIQSFHCNQGDWMSLANAASWAGPDLDLIIDDGSHNPVHQVTTALCFVPCLAPGGLYMIEDVAHPDIVIPQLPYHVERIYFADAARDPNSHILLIHGGTK
jgi:hypothetical protein